MSNLSRSLDFALKTIIHVRRPLFTMLTPKEPIRVDGLGHRSARLGESVARMEPLAA